MTKYTIIDKIKNDLNFSQVWFAMSLVQKGEECVPPLINRRFAELMFHHHPQLPLSDKDKANKLIYPSRTYRYKQEYEYERKFLKIFE